jgi:hypothetical protein
VSSKENMQVAALASQRVLGHFSTVKQLCAIRAAFFVKYDEQVWQVKLGQGAILSDRTNARSL